MNSPELHARVSKLFETLIALGPEERARALERAARDEPALAAEVASLLAHHVDDGWLEAGHAGAWPDIPAELGPYRVLARIGRGGSGLVFLARQREPVERLVAIKIVPEATHDAELAARFLVERRALERADHPNIARILDAGRTDEGLPYLVMEYIDGESITDYCRERGASIAARIELVRTVAAAVHHAHQRGVIHRDLKPANVLVRELEQRPVPYVLDFGIAKPIGEAFGRGLDVTSGLPLGTPSYMAPEQTGLGDVGVTADVYALGAVLYELVVGRPPLAAEPGAAGDPLDVLRRIREEQPPPASQARRAAAREAHGALGAPGAQSLPRAFEHDLDAIVAKALAKEPERRYESASAFAEDLGRLLANEPVTARAPTWSYRATRFIDRNRVPVAAGAAVLTALVLGLVSSLASLGEARRQRAEAIEQGEALREINRFLTEDLLASASPEIGGGDATVLDVLSRASDAIDMRLAARPRVAASLHHTVGQAFSELGAFDRAQTHLERAIDLWRSHAGFDAADTLRSEIAAASLLVRREHYEPGLSALEDCIVRARRVLGPDDAATFTAINDLGVALESLGRYPEARAALTEALAGRTRLLGPADPHTLMTLGNLAFVVDNEGHTDEALELQREALRLARTAEGDTRFLIFGLENNIGATLQDLERDDEAAPHLRRAEALAGEILGSDHPHTLTVRGNLAGLESELGDPNRAAELYLDIWERRRVLSGDEAQATLQARYGYFDCVRKSGRSEEAVVGFDALLGDMLAAVGEGHWLVAQTRGSLARALLEVGRPGEAREHALCAEAELLALYGPDHLRTTTVRSMLETIAAALR